MGIVALFLAAGCRGAPKPAVLSHGDTFAEMRTIKGKVTVTAPGEAARPPYPRERFVDGEAVTLGEGRLAWLRRDAGAVWLVEGPARLSLRESSVSLTEGRAFVDCDSGPPVEIDSPRGSIELSDARASIVVRKDGTEEVYVLRGSARAGAAGRAEAGERLTLTPNGPVTRTPAVAHAHSRRDIGRHLRGARTIADELGVSVAAAYQREERGDRSASEATGDGRTSEEADGAKRPHV
jgi:hypothetical protein